MELNSFTQLERHLRLSHRCTACCVFGFYLLSSGKIHSNFSLFSLKIKILVHLAAFGCVTLSEILLIFMFTKDYSIVTLVLDEHTSIKTNLLCPGLVHLREKRKTLTFSMTNQMRYARLVCVCSFISR